jgi:hypothetical protein
VRCFVVVLLALAVVPAGCSLAVVYVDLCAPGPTHDGSSWDKAFVTIQQGVNAATPNGEVWVADGTYVGKVVMGTGVRLCGGFLGAEPGGYENDFAQRDIANNVATIDADYSGTCVTMANGSVLDGFTITHGTGTSKGGQLTGGGILCSSLYSVAKIANNTIVGNSAQNGGGIASSTSWPSVSGNTISDNRATSGGGVYCSGSSPNIFGNLLTHNEATGSGGGIGAFEGSTPTIDGNVIDANSAAMGGGVYCGVSGSSPWIFASRIEANGGGGIVAESCKPTIIGNTIAGNSGGGICVCGSGNMPSNIMYNLIAGNTGSGIVFTQTSMRAPDYIIGNFITDNAGDDGGGICCTGPLFWIELNTISGNRATNGGGIYLQGGTGQTPYLVLSANTITGNSATESGGGVCIESGGPALNGNLVAGNSAVVAGGGIACTGEVSPALLSDTLTHNRAPEGPGIACMGASPSTLTIADSVLWDGLFEIANPDGSAFTITYSDIQGGWPGEGNIDADPGFIDAEDGDFHLSPGSPCIDVGDNSAPDLAYRDTDGDPRVCNGDNDAVAIVDMGCDEYRAEHERTGAPEGLFLPHWTWFSIPLDPVGSADASEVLGYDCRNRVFGWDDAVKNYLLYPDDFRDLGVGPSYIGWLYGEQAPVYEGTQPDLPFTRTLPAAGWCWVGVPATQDILAEDLLLKKGDDIRSPMQDAQAGYPWLNWNWIYWDAVNQTASIMNPLGLGDDDTLHPWYGYLVWAYTENVTIQFP